MRLLTSLLVAALPALALATQPPAPAGPAATISLASRQSRVTPHRTGFTHTGGGNIDVSQPAGDTLIVTMTGVAVAGGHTFMDSLATQEFTLDQCFDIALDKPGSKDIKLTLEARVIGILRSHRLGGGTAEESGAATIASGSTAIATIAVPGHAVSCGDNLSINDREGPLALQVAPGRLTLHQNFNVSVRHPHTLCLCKAASAEFAPEPALDPLWISYWEPFHGVAKKDFGFQVILKVTP
jgi:hypothetical protein